MFERALLVSYHEIGLKGRNRSAFERRLADNIAAAVQGLPVGSPRRFSSRIIVPVPRERDLLPTAEVVRRVPGVNSVSLVWKTSRDDEDVERAALTAVEAFGPFETFAVESRRSNTDHERSSQEMNRWLGDIVRLATGARVDLTAPDLTLALHIVQGDAYVYTQRLPGVGGLPVGTAGRVVSLLSAGIDSPVATWRIVRRGAVAVGVHFSGEPHTNDASERLVHEIATALEPAGGLARVYTVPFGDIQREVSLLVPPDLRVIMYRRLMIRIAEAIARPERARALVTGESLGQVASQTLENIAAVDEAATLPVFRPLVGTDKLEIMAEARTLGTYEISIQNHDDCCTLFMPRNPETHARMPVVKAVWAELPVERMVADALVGLRWRDFRCPSYRPPKEWRTIVATHEGESP